MHGISFFESITFVFAKAKYFWPFFFTEIENNGALTYSVHFVVAFAV